MLEFYFYPFSTHGIYCLNLPMFEFYFFDGTLFDTFVLPPPHPWMVFVGPVALRQLHEIYQALSLGRVDQTNGTSWMNDVVFSKFPLKSINSVSFIQNYCAWNSALWFAFWKFEGRRGGWKFVVFGFCCINFVVGKDGQFRVSKGLPSPREKPDLGLMKLH